MVSVLGVVVFHEDADESRTGAGAGIAPAGPSGEARAIGVVRAALAGVPGVRLEPVAGSERFASLVETLSPSYVPGPGFVAQALRNARARVEFLDAWAPLTAEQVAELAGSAAGNRRATAHRWREQGAIFAVEHQQRALFPSFEFDIGTGRPKPAIRSILAELPPALVEAGWQLAFWFTTPADVLDGHRPVDVLDADPDAVIDAARAERRDWDDTAGATALEPPHVSV